MPQPAAPDALASKLRQALKFQQERNLVDAERVYREILAARPAHFDALHMLGVLHYQRGQHRAAVDLIGRAIETNPAVAAAHLNLGPPLQKLRRFEEALASYDRALALSPDYVNALLNRGNVLQDLHRTADALASYERALALAPDHPEALYNRGNALLDLERLDDALACYDRALELRPGLPQALYNRGIALQERKRPDESARSFAQVLARVPDYPWAKGRLQHARLHCCDWADFESGLRSIDADVRAGRPAIEPFVYQAISASPGDLRACAEIIVRERFPQAPAPLWDGERHANAKIRIGYLAGEFRQQATSVLMAELFERHDRGRFELFAFDSGWDDGSALRRRVVAAFDEIVDIAGTGDRDAAGMVRQRNIDILVNLNGYCGRARQGLFSHRPSPVQVNYLGFPGTLGAAYIDYIVADAHVIPPEHDAFYVEKVVRLPDSYQANDSRRHIDPRTPSRAEAGLPDTGFVFCCFNNNYKIAPGVFSRWMRLLRAVPGSVLWLLEDNPVAARNLRREAQQRGVAPERLAFAPRLELPLHLARHRLADLFLDTLPYNAHTTASDALWTGLPVLTCLGTAFAGRVAYSLLDAVGLPELVTRSGDEYEALALELATTPARLAALREKLARHREAFPLFDTERFRRHIESAYVTMWERAQRGEAPAAFSVPRLPPAQSAWYG
jgi:protein O-GlcNAc transferase